jgi:23S rRNA (uracil1939-C5)-methyltransferase
LGGFSAERRPVRTGDVVSLEVQSLADGPDALCLADGYVVFVPFALPGERVRVRISSAGRKHGRGDLLAVERASPERVTARCAHFGTCGGCDFQVMAEAAQRRVKTQRVAKALAFALKVPADSLPMRALEAPPEPWGQRNKIALVLHPDPERYLRAGLYARRSQSVVPLRECPVSSPDGLAVGLRLADALRMLRPPIADPQRQTPGLRALVVRTANGTGEPHVLLVGTEPGCPQAEELVAAARTAGAVGVAYNCNPDFGPNLLGRETRLLAGPTRVRERVEAHTYLVSPGAFFQTSAWGVGHLVRAVRAAVPESPGRDLVDLYCGGGLLTLALADRGRRIVGIEGNPYAIEDARASARLGGVRNAEFVVGRVEDEVRGLAGALDTATLVLDPPRDGCAPGVIEAVTGRLRPDRVVYVSCEPNSLARDAAALAAGGYRLASVAPFDMFPQTHHVETLAVFERPAVSSPRPR